MRLRNQFLTLRIACVFVFFGAAVADAADRALPDNPFGADINKACGPACLSFLDSFYTGTESDHAAVLRLCPPGPDGVSISQMQGALHELGFHTFAFRSAVADLARLKHPSILLCGDGSSANHFVVLLKSERGRSLVFNPPRALEWREFRFLADHYEGIGLMVSRTPIDETDVLLPRHLDWHWWASGAIVMLLILSTLRVSRLPPFLQTAVVAGMTIGVCLMICVGCREGDRVTTADSRSVNLGEVLQGTPIVHTFALRNTTSVPFDVKEVSKACDCKGMEVDVDFEKAVTPGESLMVTLRADTTTYRGPLARSALVTTTSKDPQFAVMKLTIRATVDPRIQAVPPQISFGVVRGSEAQKRSLTIRIADPRLRESITEVKSSNPFVSVSREPSIPGTSKFTVSLDPRVPGGDIFGAVTLLINDSEVRDLTVPLHGRVEQDIRAVPSQLVLPSLLDPEDPPALLQIESRSGHSFEIDEVTFPPGVQGSYSPKEGETSAYILRITRVDIQSDHEQQFIAIRASGTHDFRLHVPITRVAGQHRSILVKKS